MRGYHQTKENYKTRLSVFEVNGFNRFEIESWFESKTLKCGRKLVFDVLENSRSLVCKSTAICKVVFCVPFIPSVLSKNVLKAS